jgi:hypothetical protein
MDWLQALRGWAQSASLVNGVVGELQVHLKNLSHNGCNSAEAAKVCTKMLANVPQGALRMMGPESVRKLLMVCAGGLPLAYEKISLVRSSFVSLA